MRDLLCKIGLHKDDVIGTAYNPYLAHTVIVAFGCKNCGRKSTKGEVWDEEDSRLTNLI